MATRNTIFVPLAEVPSSFLLYLQDLTLTQRANDATNSLGTSLDTASLNHNSRVAGVIYLQDGSAAAMTTMDAGVIDYRDRMIRVVGAFDPTLDVRPGQAGDTGYPLEQYDETFYSAAGTVTRLLGSRNNAIIVTSGGALQARKYVNGYLWLQVFASTKIGAR